MPLLKQVSKYVTGIDCCKHFLLLAYSKLGSIVGTCLIFAFVEIGDKISHLHSCKQHLFLDCSRLGSRLGPCLNFAFAEIGDKIRH